MQEKVLVFFRLVDPVKKKYKCLIENCRKDELSGEKKFNLVTHVRAQHRTFYEKCFGNDQICTVQNHPLPYRRLKHLQTCVDIVAVDGNPFTKLHEIGIGSLLQGELDALKVCGFGDGLGRPNYPAIKKHIRYLAGEIQKQIKLEVRGRFVAVMVDTATKHDLSILGLSIQYIYEGHLKIRTIGMINLTEPQTALHLKDVILKRLQIYEISKQQLISFNTDNANSMTAMVQLINDHPADNIDSVDDEDDIGDGDNSDDEEENDCHSNILFDMNAEESNVSDSGTDDEDRRNEIEEILNENSDFDQLLKELQRTFSAYTMNINGIRCAAHTIQLAVQDALASINIKTLLKKCKKMCKLLRKKKTRFILRRNNIAITQPRLDCKTRWNSEFRMVNNTFHFKFLFEVTKIVG